MKQTHTGRISNVNPFTGLETSVSKTQNELVNVCKSCGQTGYLYKSEDDYKKQQRIQKRIQERKAQIREGKAQKVIRKDSRKIKDPQGAALKDSLTGGIALLIITYVVCFVLLIVGHLYDIEIFQMAPSFVVLAPFVLSTLLGILFYFSYKSENLKLKKESDNLKLREQVKQMNENKEWNN